MKKLCTTMLSWALRYLPGEIIGTCSALAGAFAVHALTHSLAAAAIAGAISEAVGFYGYFAVRSSIAYYIQHRTHARWHRVYLTAGNTVRDMLVEFGFAEVVDGFFVRPFLMYVGPHILHNFGWGILAGKLVADVLFFVLAGVGYEIKKKLNRKV